MTKVGVDVYLAGGGMKCVYQASFLKRLEAETEVPINNVVGLSFGSVMGYGACTGRHEEIIEFCRSLSPANLVPCFDLWGYGKFVRSLPLVGRVLGSLLDIIWILNALRVKGLFRPTFGEGFLQRIAPTGSQSDKLRRFRCVVYNVTRARTEAIEGTHPLIADYIVASCSRWLIFPPRLIRRLRSECECGEQCADTGCGPYHGSHSPHDPPDPHDLCQCTHADHHSNEYIDAGFHGTIPYDLRSQIPAEQRSETELLLTTEDIRSHQAETFTTGTNLLEYLDNLVSLTSGTLSRNRLEEWMKEWMKEWGHTPDTRVFVINYRPRVTRAIEIDRDLVTTSLEDGDRLYEKFRGEFTTGPSRPAPPPGLPPPPPPPPPPAPRRPVFVEL